MKAALIWGINVILMALIPELFTKPAEELREPVTFVYGTLECAVYENSVEVTAPTWWGSFYKPEQIASIEDAICVNIRSACRADLRPIVYAIGRAENGRPGREFGVLYKNANTFRQQAGQCAATVQKNWDRWNNGTKDVPFLVFLRNRYCPVGAENDPQGLNNNWLKNVTFFSQL